MLVVKTWVKREVPVGALAVFENVGSPGDAMAVAAFEVTAGVAVLVPLPWGGATCSPSSCACRTSPVRASVSSIIYTALNQMEASVPVGGYPITTGAGSRSALQGAPGRPVAGRMGSVGGPLSGRSAQEGAPWSRSRC